MEEEQPILQDSQDSQIQLQRPEALGGAWVYIEEVVRGIIDGAVPESGSEDSSQESGQEEEITEGLEEWNAWAMEEGNAGYGYH